MGERLNITKQLHPSRPRRCRANRRHLDRLPPLRRWLPYRHRRAMADTSFRAIVEIGNAWSVNIADKHFRPSTLIQIYGSHGIRFRNWLVALSASAEIGFAI